MTTSSPTLLIDGDEYLYSTTSGLEVECDWGDDLWTLHNDLKECKKVLGQRLDEIANRIFSEGMILCLSDDTNFRKGVLPSYKSKRKTVRKPVGYKALKEWAQENYPTVTLPGLEADDVMGILSTQSPGKYVIVSADKDMKTIPGFVYRENELQEINEGQADYWFLYQTLCGDVTDGYKGCPGIGPKTAEKLLLTFAHETKHESSFDVHGAWNAVMATFAKAGLTEEDALQQARCARILRASDWDANKQTVKLWTPQ